MADRRTDGLFGHDTGFLIVLLLYKVASALEPMALGIGEDLPPHLQFFLTARDVA